MIALAWTLSDFVSLDIRDLRRQHALEGAYLHLANRRQSVSLEITRQHEALHLEWSGRTELVCLTSLPCNYGGQREYFLCPQCGRRVEVLYLRRGWSCRRCMGLIYESQTESRLDRLIRKARKIRRRVGGTINLWLPFPPKPPRMWDETYMRLYRQGRAVEKQVHDAMLAFGLAQQAWMRQMESKIRRMEAKPGRF